MTLKVKLPQDLDILLLGLNFSTTKSACHKNIFIIMLIDDLFKTAELCNLDEVQVNKLIKCGRQRMMSDDRYVDDEWIDDDRQRDRQIGQCIIQPFKQE